MGIVARDMKRAARPLAFRCSCAMNCVPAVRKNRAMLALQKLTAEALRAQRFHRLRRFDGFHCGRLCDGGRPPLLHARLHRSRAGKIFLDGERPGWAGGRRPRGIR